jgi:hypothetical protein
MDEKIQQLTNEQLLDVIVLVEENKIIQAIQYIATHTAFQYDDAQEIVTELTKRHDAALKACIAINDINNHAYQPLN